MQRIEGQLLLSPTDLTKHLACAHVTTLDLLALDGRDGRDDTGGPGLLRATSPDDALQLVCRKGTEHESAYLQRLRSAGLSVAEIPTRFDLEGRRQAEADTLAAMRAGVDVVYQATFFDGRWRGHADFLLRTDSAGASGRLVLRHRGYQAGPPAEGAGAAADGHLRASGWRPLQGVAPRVG